MFQRHMDFLDYICTMFKMKSNEDSIFRTIGTFS